MTYADVKIRKEYADMLRGLSIKMRIKIADAVALWPHCPGCGGLLAQVGKDVIVCSNCGRRYSIADGP